MTSLRSAGARVQKFARELWVPVATFSVLCAFVAPPAFAVPINFFSITWSNATGVAPGSNKAPLASSITDIYFDDLQSGQAFRDVLGDLQSGALRIGTDVQGFEGGGSESFVNTPIPEPGTMVGLCTFGIVVAGARRLRQRASA